MIPLSAAILRGIERRPDDTFYDTTRPAFKGASAADVLGAAVIGQLPAGAVPDFEARIRSMSPQQMAAFVLHETHRAWPHIGQSVRYWPKMAEELERDRLIPRLKPLQEVYRREIHVSLWAVITGMFDAGESRTAIAEFLARHGL